MSNNYNNFGVTDTPVGTPSTQYGSFGLVNSTMSGLSTIQNTVTESVSPTALGSGVLNGDIQSANFATGVSGWRIRANGTAEFQSVTGLTFSGISISGATITGGLIRTSVSGKRVVISGTDSDVEFYDTGGNAVGAVIAGPSSDVIIFAGTPPAFNGYSFSQTAFVPNPSTSDLGSTSFPWNNVYALSYHTDNLVFWSSGTGSPQGVVTASPGSIYTNLSGGAGTTLYIKESGTNTNTGWVAK